MSQILPLRPTHVWIALVSWLFLAGAALADVSRFVGSYAGTAEVEAFDGTMQQRDMSVEISQTDKGFIVAWSTKTYRAGRDAKEKAYQIEFVPSDRDGIFAAAMARNVFGHSVQQDPMKGEPYVWSRIVGDTLTVYSLFVNEEGGYELQQFDRTLVDGGLQLEFTALFNGERQRSVSTFLERQ
jgi:hypothetical protein